MGAMHNDNNPDVLVIPLGSVTTDNTQLPAGHMTKKGKIKSVKIQNQADLAASDANYVELTLRIVGGATLATYDSRAANQGALVKNVAKDLVLAANVEVPAGSNLELSYAETGTVGMTLGLLLVEYYPY